MEAKCYHEDLVDAILLPNGFVCEKETPFRGTVAPSRPADLIQCGFQPTSADIE